VINSEKWFNNSQFLDELEVGNKAAASYPSKKAGQGPEELKYSLSFFSFLLLPLLWTLTRTEEIRKNNQDEDIGRK
jgi:hypothetical protein